jgi:hypothetical protein
MRMSVGVFLRIVGWFTFSCPCPAEVQWPTAKRSETGRRVDERTARNGARNRNSCESRHRKVNAMEREGKQVGAM